MIFRQLFDHETYTYTYLLADSHSKDAAIIDPVLGNTAGYLRLLDELGLKLIYAIDTHTHADHITALGKLRTATNCQTILGAESESACVTKTVNDGDTLPIGKLELTALHTPGHTNDSYSFAMSHAGQNYLFTGDTLLIRGSGRTDFQQGDALSQYDSITKKLLSYPDATWVYPGHDYKGWLVSTVAEEKKHNPRLQVKDGQAYAELMGKLDLPDPQYMDVAIPANQACGQS